MFYTDFSKIGQEIWSRLDKHFAFKIEKILPSGRKENNPFYPVNPV